MAPRAPLLPPLRLAKLLLASVLLMLSHCGCGCRPCGDTSGPSPVAVEVRDGQGNLVPIERASVIRGEQSASCYEGRCTTSFDGAATLRVEAAGEVLEREVELYRVDSGPYCTNAPTQEVVLTLAGEGCSAATGAAITGRVLDALGKEVADATLEVELYGEVLACDTKGATFSCPSLSPYPADYVLRAELGTTQLERQVHVDAEACSVVLTDATIDLSARDCPAPTAWAIRGYVRAAADKALTVRVEVEGFKGRTCEQQRSSNGEHVWFYCPEFIRRARGAPQLGEVIDIDIAGPDNGSVLLVEMTATYFVFQTVDSDKMGAHPENGAREFGFERSEVGLRFYTRGVSRPGNIGVRYAGALPQKEGWTSLMHGIADRVNALGGKSSFSSFWMYKDQRPN